MLQSRSVAAAFGSQHRLRAYAFRLMRFSTARFVQFFRPIAEGAQTELDHHRTGPDSTQTPDASRLASHAGRPVASRVGGTTTAGLRRLLRDLADRYLGYLMLRRRTQNRRPQHLRRRDAGTAII